MKSLPGKRLMTLLGIDNSKKIVEMVKDRLGCQVIGRKVSETDGDFELKENVSPYRVGFMG